MNSTHPILRITLLSLLVAVWLPAGSLLADTVSSQAPVTAREVSGEMAVGDAGIAFQDVTEAYSKHLAGSRDDEIHYFMSAFGDMSADYGRKGILTSDGGGLTAGMYYNDYSGTIQFLLVKLTNQGVVEWARIAGDGWDWAYDVCETSDGGYVIVGQTNMLGAGGNDIYLIKFDGSGIPVWSRVAGGSSDDGAAGVCETPDGDLVVAGYTYSFGSGDADAILAAFEADGTPSWSTLISGPQNDSISSIRLTADDGFVCAGSTSSFGAGYDDAFLLRFDSTGALLWGETLGEQFVDQGRDALEASNGDLVLTGQTAEGSGASDLLFAIFDAGGTLLTASTVGGSPNGDYGNAVCELTEGGYAVAGTTHNFGFGGTDAFLVTFDQYGAYQWARVFGGTEAETANSVAPLPGGGVFMVGETATFSEYNPDPLSMLLVVANQDGLIPGCEYGAGCYPDVTNPVLTVTAATPAITAPALSVETPALNWSFIYWPNPLVCQYTPPEKRYWLAVSGESSSDEGRAIGQTSDGGFIVASSAIGYPSATVQGVMLTKYDALGDLQWASLAGGDSYDLAWDLVITEDDGCIVAGYTESFGVGNYDALVMGFDAAGGLNWAKTVGSPRADSAKSIRRMPDGDYIVAGGTGAAGVDQYDALAFTIDASGDIGWIRAVGQTDQTEYGHCAIGTADGGALLAGIYDEGTTQYCQVIKLDANGDVDWNSVHYPGNNNGFFGIVTMPDGHYVLGGQAAGDAFFAKFNSDTGARMWARRAGTVDSERYFDMRATADGGIIAAGWVLPPSVLGTTGVLAKFDGNGVPQWTHYLNDDSDDFNTTLFGVLETADGGFAAAGYTRAFGAGSDDVLVLHTDRNGWVGECPYIWEVESGNNVEYPASFGYPMYSQTSVFSIYTQSPVTMTPALQHEEICSAVPTTSGSFSCTPAYGVAPFTASMQAALVNEYDGITRRIAGRINVTLASGGYYPNWRAGFTNIAPGDSYAVSWNQNIPALAALHGENRFVLLAEDVTPAPYNQPPYPPSGDVDTDLFILKVNVP